MKLSKETAELLHSRGLTYSDIGELFGISASRAVQIRHGNKNVKKYQKTEFYLNYSRNYKRQNILVIDGKVVRVNKRPRPDNCEVCGRIVKRLDYHHWDDDKPEFGIWLCQSCHKMAEGIDKDLHGKYIFLKESILLNI